MLGPIASRHRMPDPTTLLLIRQGQTDWIARGVAGRLPDVHFNDEGRDQAARLAGRGPAPFPVAGACPRLMA
jgi:broad specificity phosphatase PhoE